jgi:hypothetical protein
MPHILDGEDTSLYKVEQLLKDRVVVKSVFMGTIITVFTITVFPENESVWRTREVTDL